jgi:hypothetical protein
VAAVVLVATAAHGSPSPSSSPIGVGEVTAEAASRDVDVAALRAMVNDAVARLDTAGLPREGVAVLSLSLVKLDSRASDPAEVTCVVSATLRDRARGSIFAILEGSARGQDEPGRVRALERATMRAAVSSAVARVPEAMKHRRR